MFVDCPKCSTKFLVEPEQLGETGRKVRCGSCMHVWHQDPPAPEVKQVVEEVRQEQKENLQKAVEEAAAGKIPSLPTVIKTNKTAKWLRAAAAVLLLINALAFVAFNKHVIGQTRFHDIIGNYDTSDITISKAQVTNTAQTGKANTFYVSLEVQNEGKKKLSMPAYRYAVMDEKNHVLAKSPIVRSKQSLGAGENFTFRAIKVEDSSKKGKYIVLDVGNPTEISSRW